MLIITKIELINNPTLIHHVKRTRFIPDEKFHGRTKEIEVEEYESLNCVWTYKSTSDISDTYPMQIFKTRICVYCGRKEKLTFVDEQDIAFKSTFDYYDFKFNKK